MYAHLDYINNEKKCVMKFDSASTRNIAPYNRKGKMFYVPPLKETFSSSIKSLRKICSSS